MTTTRSVLVALTVASLAALGLAGCAGTVSYRSGLYVPTPVAYVETHHTTASYVAPTAYATGYAAPAASASGYVAPAASTAYVAPAASAAYVAPVAPPASAAVPVTTVAAPYGRATGGVGARFTAGVSVGASAGVR